MNELFKKQKQKTKNFPFLTRFGTRITDRDQKINLNICKTLNERYFYSIGWQSNQITARLTSPKIITGFADKAINA